MLESFRADEPTVYVSIPDNDVELAEAAVDAGAHGLKVHINVDHRASGTSFGSLEEERPTIEEICELDVPVGIVPGADTGTLLEVLPTLAEVPVDFVDAYAHHLPASAQTLTEHPIWASASDEYSSAEIESLDGTPLDVVELGIQPKARYGESMTTRDLATYVDLDSRLGKPTVVPSQLALTPADVATLVDYGVTNVLLGAVVTGSTPETIEESVSSIMSVL